MIIGRSGEGAKKLKDDLLQMMVKFKIVIPEELKTIQKLKLKNFTPTQ